MKKAKFDAIIEDGINRGKNFMVVKIETEGNPGPEIIVNPAENFAAKSAYYNKAYNDDMELIAAKNAGKSVRIVDAIMTSNLNDLNWFAW
jgi:hypothetical protein